jgi:hypothetical protein
MKTTQFLFLENGINVAQLKNTAKTQLKKLKKEGNKKVKLSEILDSLTKEITGKSYKSSLKEIKDTAPYLDNGVFYMPFENEGNKILVKLETLTNEDEMAAFKKTIISMGDSEFEVKLYDILFFPELINIEKLDNGWKLNLYITEQAKNLNGFVESDEVWFEVKKTDEGLVIDYYTAEYCGELDGYNVNCIKSTYAFWDELVIEEEEEEELSIECYGEEITSVVMSELEELLGFEIYSFSGRAPCGMGKNLTITHDAITLEDARKVESYLKSKSFKYVGYYGKEEKIFYNVNNSVSDWYYLTGEQSYAPNEHVSL